jgi:hypothetical protein
MLEFLLRLAPDGLVMIFMEQILICRMNLSIHLEKCKVDDWHWSTRAFKCLREWFTAVVDELDVAT